MSQETLPNPMTTNIVEKVLTPVVDVPNIGSVLSMIQNSQPTTQLDGLTLQNGLTTNQVPSLFSLRIQGDSMSAADHSVPSAHVSAFAKMMTQGDCAFPTDVNHRIRYKADSASYRDGDNCKHVVYC